MCVEYPIVSTCMLYYVCDRRVDSNGLASQARSQNFKIHFISQNGCLGLIRVSHHEHITLSRGHMPGNIWGRSQTTLTSLCLFFDPLPPYVDIFYLINVDKNKTFLDYLPTSPCKCSLWTTSCLVCLWHSKVGCICWHLWRSSTSDINRCIRLKSMKYH